MAVVVVVVVVVEAVVKKDDFAVECLTTQFHIPEILLHFTVYHRLHYMNSLPEFSYFQPVSSLNKTCFFFK